MYEYKIVSLETFMEIPEIKAIKNKERFKAGDSDLSRSNCVVDFMQMMFDYMGNQGWEYIGITRTNSSRVDVFATGKGLGFLKGVADGVLTKAMGGGASGIITNEGTIETYIFKRLANNKVIFDDGTEAGLEKNRIINQSGQFEIEKQQFDEEGRQTELTVEQSGSGEMVGDGPKIGNGLVNSVSAPVFDKSKNGSRSLVLGFSIFVILGMVYFYNPNIFHSPPSVATKKNISTQKTCRFMWNSETKSFDRLNDFVSGYPSQKLITIARSGHESKFKSRMGEIESLDNDSIVKSKDKLKSELAKISIEIYYDSKLSSSIFDNAQTSAKLTQICKE